MSGAGEPVPASEAEARAAVVAAMRRLDAARLNRGASGNELRAAVLGVNDGLVSNF